MKSVNMILVLALSFGLNAMAQVSGSPASSSGGGQIPPDINKQRQMIIDSREAQQEKRIEEGEAKGSLTKHEEKVLEKQQEHIKKVEAKAEKDGSISEKEFKRIERLQNKASNDIKRKKHNARK